MRGRYNERQDLKSIREKGTPMAPHDERVSSRPLAPYLTFHLTYFFAKSRSTCEGDIAKVGFVIVKKHRVAPIRNTIAQKH